jgi:predicted DNA-binding antitoxin AbrB/MazE fold protein
MQQTCDAIFEKGVLRPLTNLHLNEGQSVKLVIESPSPKKKLPEKGLIAQLTANPIPIADFKPLTREEANERW